MSFSIDHEEGKYDCQKQWLPDSYFKISSSNISYIKEGRIKTKKDPTYKYLFAVLHPVSDNIKIPDSYIFEKWQRPRMWVTGYGRDIQESEAAAYVKYCKISQCNHDFILSGEEINGDATCSKCSVYVSEYFLNKNIHYAKYNSLAFHQNDVLFEDIKISHHLMSLTQEMAYDPNLKIDEKINLMCAGWMHHTNGQLQYNDIVEKILKYFYLDPKSMYESMLLKYYDSVDMIKFLLNSKKYNILKKEVDEANILLKILHDFDLPHASFLQSYILMGEQTLISVIS